MDQSTGSQLPVIGIVSRIDQSATWTEYELYGQGATYIRAVALAGGAPVIIPLELGKAGWRSIYDRIDGLLFPGGVDVHTHMREPGMTQKEDFEPGTMSAAFINARSIVSEPS